MLSDQLIGYTKSRVNNNKLTYSFRKGALWGLARKSADKALRDLNDQIGLKLKYTKNRGRADVIIGHGVIPEGATAAAVWTDVRWEIRFPTSFYADRVLLHEMGHVLGFYHMPEKSRSLMVPDGGNYMDFTRPDLNKLQSVWGKP